MRGGGDGRFGRCALGCVEVDGERLVTSLDRHHRVVDRDPDVGEEGVPLRRRQHGGSERLRADGVPVGDERVRWAAASTAAAIAVTGDGVGEARTTETASIDAPTRQMGVRMRAW